MNYTDWFDKGFTELVSVIPPDATLAVQSTIKPDQLGKIPGRLLTDHTWAGYDYIRTPQPTREQVEMWGVQGANLGILAKRYPAIDIDCDDPALAQTIRHHALLTFGPAPVRTRGTARCVLMYRASEPFTKRRITFEVRGVKCAVDILADGQQYLIAGTHPSGTDYRWSPLRFNPVQLIDITAAEVDAWLQELKAQYGAMVTVVGDRELAPPQEQLRGDFAAVALAVGHIPNTERSRDTYIRMGAAIKAAVGDSTDAFTLWWDWCQKLPDGRKTPSEARDEWSRIKPPFAVGAQYLSDLAREHGYQPPITEFEVVAAPAADPEAPAKHKSEAAGDLPSRSDAWLVDQFVDIYGAKVRFCVTDATWLAWGGDRWASNDTAGRVTSWAAKVCQAAAVGQKSEEGRRLCSNAVLSAVVAYARHDPRVAVRMTDFDADPWLLNTPGGVVDLKTGRLTSNDAQMLMTKRTAVAPDATMVPVEWLRFLNEATRNDPALVAYLQRLVGYALTGSTREHIMAFLHGGGGNGKGTFLNTIVRVMGDYAKTASMTTFTASKFDQHPADLATLVGSRLVVSQETQEGRAWDEVRVKAITGGDPLTARFMRENPFTYEPQFTLIFSGNHRPHLHTVDAAVRRRMHLVPFTVTPRVVDRLLDEKLKIEMPGILAWAIAGTALWLRDGLVPPPIVVAATEEYFAEEDPFGRWMSTNTAPTPTEGSEIGPLYVAWREWCGHEEEHPGTEKAFAAKLRATGTRTWHHATTRRAMYALALRESVASFDVIPSPVASSPLLD